MSIFRPRTMMKVQIIVPEGSVVPVTLALAASRAFHLLPTERLGTRQGREQDENWPQRASAFATLEQRVLAVMEALDVDPGQPPQETPEPVEPEMVRVTVERLEEETRVSVEELQERQQQLDQLQRQVDQLQPIADLEIDLGALHDLHYTFALLGTMPTANLDRLRSSLESIPSVLVPLRSAGHLTTVMLIGTRRDADVLERAARSAYLNPLKLSVAYEGTPAEALAVLAAEIEQVRLRVARDRAVVEHLHELRIGQLRHLLWQIRAGRKLAETIAQYGRLRYTYLIAGWTPKQQVQHLRQMVKEASGEVVFEVIPPVAEEKTQVPVALENASPLKGFQGLVTNYGYPRYREIDPTPIMALTFPLIFGVMFGDVGQGLLLILLGALLVSRRVAALRGLANLGGVIVACGVAATVFGFLYGSLFGFEGVLQPLWIQPLEDPMTVLIFAVGLGVALLTLGLLFNLVNAALAGHWGELLFSRNGLAGLVFYWSLLGLGAGAFISPFPLPGSLFGLLAALSGLALVLAEPLGNLVAGERPIVDSDLGTYLIQAPFELFETVITFLSNTVSYVRMGAFAVAHGSLSLAVFIIAEIASPARGIGYWVVVALGNLFIIGFEGMIVAIQTLRLEYYEFFSKFFSGGGDVPYRPLALISAESSQ